MKTIEIVLTEPMSWIYRIFINGAEVEPSFFFKEYLDKEYEPKKSYRESDFSHINNVKFFPMDIL